MTSLQFLKHELPHRMRTVRRLNDLGVMDCKGVMQTSTESESLKLA